MAKEPTFPSEATVGKETPAGAEVLDVAASASATAKALEEKAAAAPTKPGSWTPYVVAGAAVGVGSAALVAALLYGRSRKSSDKKS